VTTSSGTSIHTRVRLTGGLPVRFVRRGAPLPASRSPPRQAHQRRGGLARPWLNVDDAWCEALFASALQRSAAPQCRQGNSAPASPAPARLPGWTPPTKRLTALKHEGGTLDTYLANYGLFYLEADLRWIDMTAARLDALAREVRK
jgi:hypothetical protein